MNAHVTHVALVTHVGLSDQHACPFGVENEHGLGGTRLLEKVRAASMGNS